MSTQQKYVSWVEAARLPVSRVVAFSLIALLLVAQPVDKPEVVEEALRALGIVLAAVGAFGRQWCSLYIGGRKTVELVTGGPYSLCRNPLYLFSFIGAAGVALTTHSLTVVLVVTGFLLLYYPGVIRSEECKLRAAHGDSFARYCARTPALWPQTLRMSGEAPQQVDAALFRKHTLEAVWFVWGVGVMLLLDVLHEVDVLPTLFHIY